MENKPIAYSTYSLSHNCAGIYQIVKRLDVNQFRDFAGKVMEAARIHGIDIDPILAGFCSLGTFKFSKINHYYVSPGVARFCSDSVKHGDIQIPYVPNEDVEIVKRARPHKMDADELAKTLKIFANQLTCDKAFAFHFPVSEKIRSMIIIPTFISPDYKNNAFITYRFCVENGDDFWYYPVDGYTDEITKMINNSEGAQRELITLSIGLLLYMDAFPDAITETKFERTGGHHVGKKFRIEQSAIAKEEAERSVSPHYRRGHFRRLESERFINTRGQTIFVRGCFVRGVAHQLNDDAPIEESKIPIIGRA